MLINMVLANTGGLYLQMEIIVKEINIWQSTTQVNPIMHVFCLITLLLHQQILLTMLISLKATHQVAAWFILAEGYFLITSTFVSMKATPIRLKIRFLDFK